MADNTPQDIVKQGAALSAVKTSLTPRLENPTEPTEGTVIRGLGSDQYVREAYFILSGYAFNFITDRWEKYREPVMNTKGIGNMMKVLHVLKRVDFSNMEEKRIPGLVMNFYRLNMPHFLIYAKEFDLKEEDYNIIKTELFNAPLAAFYNAKNAGHRNTIRGIMSENVFLKAMEGGQEKKKNNKLFGFLPNPFKRSE